MLPIVQAAATGSKGVVSLAEYFSPLSGCQWASVSCVHRRFPPALSLCHWTVTGVCTNCGNRCCSGLDGPSEMVKQRVLNSFVARIWLERGPNGNPLWRGHVRHVQGNQETFFQDLETMTEFLERVSGVAGFGPAGRPAEDTASSEPGAAKKGKGT